MPFALICISFIKLFISLLTLMYITRCLKYPLHVDQVLIYDHLSWNNKVHYQPFPLISEKGKSNEISSFVETQATNLLNEYPVEFVKYPSPWQPRNRSSSFLNIRALLCNIATGAILFSLSTNIWLWFYLEILRL